MCQQEVSPAYGESLVESISKILSRKAEEFKERLDAARLLPLNKQAFLPSQISPDTVNAYEDAFQGANEAIDHVNSLISQRKSNLYSVIEISDLGLDAAISRFNAAVDAINADIESLNAAIRDKDNLKTRLREINDQIAYVDARDAIFRYDAAETKLHEARENLRKRREKQDRLRGERGAQEAKVRMTEIAVTSTNRFLSSVYFDAARFRLVPFGDVYRIESFGKPVAPKAISTGERNILALCYFFSEGGRGKFEGLEDSDPQYLVIDDPVSSFDMENRVGICSLLRERISHVLRANVESRVTVMTHDAATVAELEHILGDVKCDFDPSDNYGYCLLELTEGATLQYTRTRKNQYSILLKTVYDYALSEEDLGEESYVIGNVMRRVLEGYSSFNFGMDIKTIINKSEAVKKVKKEKGDNLTQKEKKQLTEEEKEFKSKRKEIQEKLIKFATRIPVFMYLTDYREETLYDVITQLEPGLFKKVTGLDVSDFNLLVSLGVFNSALMNDAVYKFRRYEDASLVYTGINKHEGEKVGLYDTSLSNYDYLYAKQQESMVAPDGSALGNGAKAEAPSPAVAVKPSVKPSASSVSRSTAKATMLGEAPVKKDWVVGVLESYNVRIADRRPKGGSLWVIGGGELDVVMNELAANGAQFTYKLEGGKATGFKAGWWLSGYPKKSEPKALEPEEPAITEDDLSKIEEGTQVFHKSFGYGEVVSIGSDRIAVRFDNDKKKKALRCF